MLQKLPKWVDKSRPETGAMQFGDDWPGMFIRGDNALIMAITLRQTIEYMKGERGVVPPDMYCLALEEVRSGWMV